MEQYSDTFLDNASAALADKDKAAFRDAMANAAFRNALANSAFRNALANSAARAALN